MNMRDILSTSMGEELPCDVEVFLMGEEVAELLARSLTHPPSCMPNGDIHVPIVFCGLNCPVAGVLPLIIRSATPPGMATSRPQDCVSLRLGGRSRVSFSVSKEAQDKDFVIEFGKAKVMMPGTNVTVVAFSRTVGEALMPLLRGNRRRVSNLGSIRPFDRQAIIDSVKTTNHIVSIEKGWGQSGIDVEIVGIIIEMEAFDYLDISLERVTYRYPHPGAQPVNRAPLYIEVAGHGQSRRPHFDLSSRISNYQGKPSTQYVRTCYIAATSIVLKSKKEWRG
ncbi:hypothetical protein L914_17266 [Phytophthora nicotianae]|uniref:Pyruvate dehydrogenase E1 component subunit beta n=1 Tax=Phytophthora nicotianae TaxID=4792 RepID=W2MHT5_PHYNI|nr:hypothetical protein L914_17266 [Phytophthora nicotianae]